MALDYTNTNAWYVTVGLDGSVLGAFKTWDGAQRMFDYCDHAAHITSIETCLTWEMIMEYDIGGATL